MSRQQEIKLLADAVAIYVACPLDDVTLCDNCVLPIRICSYLDRVATSEIPPKKTEHNEVKDAYQKAQEVDDKRICNRNCGNYPAKTADECTFCPDRFR